MHDLPRLIESTSIGAYPKTLSYSSVLDIDGMTAEISPDRMSDLVHGIRPQKYRPQ